MKTLTKVEDTRLPSLTRAVIRQTGRENLEDIARHGADAGFAGFTYYSDTVPFFKRSRANIVKLVEEMASDLGENPAEMVAGFNCLGGRKMKRGNFGSLENDREATRANTQVLREYLPSVSRCLCGGTLTDEDTQVANALAWFAAEEIARELNPDV